jgi:hypothetical protein
MARARNIKPALFKNEILGVADPIYTLLFEGLWLLADREGRLEDRPLRIKAELFPYREGLDMPAMLGWLQESGFIYRYTYGENRYIEIANFTKHQNPHKNEVASEIPSFSMGCITTDKIGTSTDGISTARADSLSLDLLIPDSLSLDSLNTDSKALPIAVAPTAQSQVEVSAKPRRSTKGKTETQEAAGETWNAYANAYFDRYGTEPVRNAKTNALINQLVQRLGADAAPHVAGYYLGMNKTFYVSNLHPLGVLVKDCESIHTQWATNRQMTDTRSRQIDQSQANYDVADEALKIYNELYAGGGQ